MKNVAIIGAGNSGLAMAAHFALNGYNVRLWNRSEDTIKSLKKIKTIHCSGIFNGDAPIDLVTTEIQEAIDNAGLILVTTPAHSHWSIAEKMAPFIKEKTLIVLNPGRTFGVIEFNNALMQAGCQSNPTIAETQTIIYTCRKTNYNSVTILAIKKDVLFSTKNSIHNSEIIQQLPSFIKSHFVPAESLIETSIGNVGMILHCAPVLLNTGWIETATTNFKYYYDGITPTVANLLEKIDSERIEVSKMLGKKVLSTVQWLQRSYGVRGNSLYECIQRTEPYKTIDAPSNLQHRYIFEDVPSGLVPIEAIGEFFGLSMKYTKLIIDLACAALNYDFRKNGRNLKRLGFKGNSTDNLIKYLF